MPFVDRRAGALLTGLLALAPATGALQAQQEWPGFRGADGSAVANVELDVATLAPEVLWRVEIGSGYSGVTVADGRVFTMVEDDGQFVLALDADSGAELWRRRVADSYLGHDGSWDGPIATPVVRDGVLVGLEPWGRLFALDVVDGEPLWSVHLAEELGAPAPIYGFGGSPTVVEDVLIAPAGGPAGTVLGLDLRTGAPRWSVGDERTSAQSPVLMTLGGRDLVVSAGSSSIFGIDAASGEIVLRYTHGGRGNRGADELVPIAAGPDRIFLHHSFDASQMIVVTPEGDGLVAERIWEERNIRSTYVPAVYHDGYVYGYNLRIFVCIDAATGELMWRSRAPGDGFPTLVDGHLLTLTKDGTLHLAPATPEGYQELVSAPVLDDLTWTPPSIAYGDVFARSRSEIVRVDLHGAGTRAVAAGDYTVPRSLDPGDGELGRFVRTLELADDPDSMIDAFLAQPRDYPIREGDSRVHFIYRGQAVDLALVGDWLGTRQDVPMVRVAGTDFYYYTAELLPDSRAQYAFLRDGEMITDPLNPLIEPTLVYNAEREHVYGDRPLPMSELRMPRWRMPDHLREAAAGTRGRVETLAIDGPRGEVEFSVYLPHGYAESAERYPVVYYHGPSPTELSAIPTTFDNLIGNGVIQPAIAVWTARQLGSGTRYAQFWAETLVPAVDEAYRTRAGAEGRVNIGTGSGALAALEVAAEYPDLSSAVAMFSLRALDLVWDPLLPRIGTPQARPLRLYLEWGVYGVSNPQEAWDNRVKLRERTQQLRDLGYEVAGGEVPDGVGWASWRNRADAALRAVLPPRR